MNLEALERAVERPVALALSGGSDSTALLLLAARWARQNGRRLLALTVDHGLNPDSVRWTIEAGALARRLGVDWRALGWTGPKPATGLPAAARRARHALLAEAARAAGARVILMGHTADDVAESALIRRDTPSHGRLETWAPSPVWPEGRGLFLLRPLLAARRARHALLAEAARAAGARVILMGHTADDVAESALIRRDTPSHGRLETWAPSPVWPEGRGLFLLRPLLAARRAELRALLTAEGLGWLEDPANTDPRFARSRARAALAMGDVATGEGALPGAQAVSASSCATFQADAAGCVRLPRAAAPELIAKALLCASGRERPSAGEAVRRVAARLQAGECFRATLGGARLLADGDGLVVVRDAGERTRGGLQPVPARLGETAVFDGRFEVAAEAEGLQVHALSGLAARLSPADSARLKAVSAEARPALPVLVDAAGEVRLPTPFGRGPGRATALGPPRLAAACGLIGDEAAAARDAIFWTGA
jgi:tRNA(Ile)-lysidine synthase